MALNQVQPFLEKTFEFLRSKEFSISPENWKTYCQNQGISLENLKKAKAELLRQSPNTSDNTEQLQQIFCCDPFDAGNVKALRDNWHKKAETQPDPYQEWIANLSIHLLDLDSARLEKLSHSTTTLPSSSLTPRVTSNVAVFSSQSSKISKELLSAIITGSIIGIFIMAALIINNNFNKPQVITHKETTIISPPSNIESPTAQKTQKQSTQVSSTIPPPQVQPNSSSQNKQVRPHQTRQSLTTSTPSNYQNEPSQSQTNASIIGKTGSKNIRSGPGTRYSTLHIAYPGDRVQVITSDTDIGGYRWYKVYFPKSGVQGWIAAQLLAIDGQSTSNPLSESSVHSNARIGGQPGSKNIRSGPGTVYRVIGKIDTGEYIEILDKSQDSGGYVWYQIRHQGSGMTGWIAAQLINIQ